MRGEDHDALQETVVGFLVHCRKCGGYFATPRTGPFACRECGTCGELDVDGNVRQVKPPRPPRKKARKR